jgi:hypothetical protein
MPLAPDHDQVVIASRDVVVVEFSTLRAWLQSALVLAGAAAPGQDGGRQQPAVGQRKNA